MFYRIFAIVSVLALLGGCTTIRNRGVTEMLEKSSDGFNKIMRWEEPEGAGKAYMPDNLQKDFAEKVKGIKVADFRVKSIDCSPEKGKATVVVEYDYLREPSVKLRTVKYVQEWEYMQEKDSSGWLLKNLPPDLK